MEFQFTVSAEAERVQGKFESRDSIETAVLEWLEGCNEGSITGDNEGEYEVTSWDVQADAKGRSGFTAPKPKTTAPPDARKLSDIPEVRNALELLRLLAMQDLTAPLPGTFQSRIHAVAVNLGPLVDGRVA